MILRAAGPEIAQPMKDASQSLVAEFARRTALRWLVVAVLLWATGTPAAESVATAWVQRYSHPTISHDSLARKVVTDHAGNVIVAGAAYNGVSRGDFLIIKYSGAGVPLWTNRYDGPESLGDAAAAAVTVDADNSVLVTGACSSGWGEAGDYVTIKYSGTGVPLWTNYYNGPGDRDDKAWAIAVDSSGNVFVTGHSEGAGSAWDYATVAYSGAGVPLWTNRYDGPGHSFDQAIALAVDSSGNAFVTGSSVDENDLEHYATIAYSSAGVPLWTNRYAGPANFSGLANAIAVDAGGNVFVTGSATSIFGSAAADYATVAYSAAGVPLWTNLYNGAGSGFNYPYGVAVDGSGNVFVTGLSEGSSIGGFATIKYSGAGVPLWTNRYNGHAAHALAVDSSGNVVVAGYALAPGPSHVTIKYSGAGATLWTREYWGTSLPQAVAVDNDSKVFVTGGSFATVAYSSAGAQMWTNAFAELGNRDDTPSALAVDSSGNVFVTGTSDPIGSGVSGANYATVAYSSAGLPLWTNRYNGARNGSAARAIGVDGSGNVLVTGWSSPPECCSSDYVTIKYSGAGIPLWTNAYGDPVKKVNYAYALAVDSSGNVVVTGRSGWSDDDYVTVKYSGTGAPLWTNRYNGPANGNDRASDVAVDSGGNVFVTGSSVGDGSGGDYLTIKYSATGALLWINRYAGPSNKTDIAAAMAVDNHDNVIVTGFSVGIGGYYDYTTVAYSGAGVPLWTNRFPGSSGSYWPAIAADSNRNVFVTGTAGDWPAFEFVTIMYSEAGVASWTNRHEGTAAAIAVDARGSVFVAGYASRSDDSLDSITIKYSGAGVPLWTNSYRGPGGGTFPRSKSSLAIGPDGAALVTGWSASGLLYDSGFDFATLKLVSVPVLEIRRSSADVILSWPSSFSDFTLQQNTSPFTSTGWSTFGGSVQDDGTNRTVTVGPPTGSQFYRLFKP